MTTSGRGVRHRKNRVDEVRSVDILELQNSDAFDKKVPWNWRRLSWFRNDKVVASISYRVEFGNDTPTALRFIYTVTDNLSCERREYDYIVPVVSTPCHYGGKRWWFICPRVIDGRSCQKRCRIIYLPPTSEYFGCRECSQLTYESRQKHRDKFYEGFEKPLREIKEAEQKLTKTNNWEKREKIWRKMSRASSAIENFHNILTNHKPKVSHKEN